MQLKLIFISLIFLLIFSPSIIANEEFDVDPGITPDNLLYFLDEWSELAGDNPEKASKYREEKIAEFLTMAEEDKVEEAKKALDKASEYGDILEKEVNPDMNGAIKERSAIIQKTLNQVSDENLAEDISNFLEKEERIVLAAEISAKIKVLCETLSGLDPVQYGETCKTDGSSPSWQKNLDKKLTKEQKEHAKIFAKKLGECFETRGERCDCEGLGVESLTRICLQRKECRTSNDESCLDVDPSEVYSSVPDYLRPILRDLERKYGGLEERRFEENIPNWEMKFMEECKKEKIESQCVEEVAKMKEMGDIEKSRPRMPNGNRIEKFGVDCHTITDLDKKLTCFEDFYNNARVQFVEIPHFDFDNNDEFILSDSGEWLDDWGDRYLSAGSDGERHQLLRDLKREANKLGYLVESIGGSDEGFEIKISHRSGVKHHKVYGGYGLKDYEPEVDVGYHYGESTFEQDQSRYFDENSDQEIVEESEVVAEGSESIVEVGEHSDSEDSSSDESIVEEGEHSDSEDSSSDESIVEEGEVVVRNSESSE